MAPPAARELRFQASPRAGEVSALLQRPEAARWLLVLAHGAGADMQLGKVLQPLAPLRHKLNFVEGLYNAQAKIGGIHSAQTGQLLSGARITFLNL